MNALADAMNAWLEGEQAFGRGDYEKSASCMQQAVAITKLIPDKKGFDRPGFLSPIYVRLTQVLGLMGRHQECLTYAEEALSFFGSLNRTFFASSIVAVQINAANSLAQTNQMSAALEMFQKAQAMLPDAPELANQGPSINQNIRVISRMLNQDRSERAPKTSDKSRLNQRQVEAVSKTPDKKWWEFWK